MRRFPFFHWSTMNKYETQLREYLRILSNAAGKGLLAKNYHYASGADFLLKHGQTYEVQPVPAGIRYGAPRCCFGNSIMACVKYGWRYVEGFAVPPSGILPVHHGWNLDENGTAFDITWREPGIAYIGVEFSLGRADNASWNGDATVLDDWKRTWPLLKDEWHGEDFERDWPQSEAMQLALKMKERKAML